MKGPSLPFPAVTRLPLMCDGTPVQQVRIGNGAINATFLTRGAVLQDLRIADVEHSLCVGSPDAAAYDDALRYFGAVVGPVANRIMGGQAALYDTRHHFDRNEGGHTTLHGGTTGTHSRNWEIDLLKPEFVVFTLNLRDGVGGFPGNRAVGLRYELVGRDMLQMTVTTTTDATTWANFAPHGFWNLDGTEDLSGHTLQVEAERYLPTDDRAMVTGEVAEVAGTPFDFRTPRPIGPGTLPRLDHNFCLSNHRRKPVDVLTLTGASGVSLHLETSEPGVQLFDAAGIDGGGALTHQGQPIGPFCGLAIEPQGWPDAPNRRNFPSVVLHAGTALQQITRWRFAV